MTTEFTPLLSLVGGMMIGLSAVILLATTGRIAGISGLASAVLPPAEPAGRLGIALAFVLGLLAAPLLYGLAAGTAPVQHVGGDLVLMAIGGLLVGIGTVTGNGCTSGHGVCGLSRLSVRSLVATLTFMACAFVTVALMRHVF